MWPDELTKKSQMHILLVEDDVVDAEALQRAFRQHQFTAPVSVVKNGREALAFLRKQCIRHGTARRYLILLDLNMPQMNGFEFLTALRQDEQLKQNIVFVLTTSKQDQDIRAAYDQQIAGYLLKAPGANNFEQLIALLKSYDQTIEFPPEVVF
ncbi:MAG: response regulator [Caldilineaceae bacterium]|nr:response regulator [Caldilineaceae bacterium]